MKLYLVLIHYLKPADEVARMRPVHRAFLADHYREGRLICSGPQTTGTGGVVLARGRSRREVEALFGQDPYALTGAARHEVIEFSCASHADGFERFLTPLPKG